MKFIKSLICNCLCINNLHKTDIRDLKLPNKFVSFKKTKNLYFTNHIYFDIYQDDIYNFDLQEQLNKYENLEKNQLLTAEHIVPQSYIKSIDNAIFDMHNIYLTNSQLNTHRSNYKYKDELEFLKDEENKNREISNFTNNLLAYNSSINYKSNNMRIFIPKASSRGIIARSIAYMKIIYCEFSLENIIDLDILVKWNYQYPPSKLEKQKNRLIYEIQGNYNEFIENLNLIDTLF